MSKERTYTFPKDAEAYINWAHTVVDSRQFTQERITPDYGVRWYDIAPQKEAREGHTPQRVLFLSPHSDDMEIAAGVAVTQHVQQGDNVQQLLLTLGSAGRFNRGFDQHTTPLVRLAELITGAEVMGIQRVGVVELNDGTLGLPEWFTDENSASLRKLGIALDRTYQPQVLYSPHPDSDVDSHPDHIVASRIAQWLYNWGNENAFYQDIAPGQGGQIQEWRRYAVWTGGKNLQPNLFIKYDQNGRFARRKHDSIRVYLSQGGEYYAHAALSKDAYIGGMIGVGSDENSAMEAFHVVKPSTFESPQWME